MWIENGGVLGRCLELTLTPPARSLWTLPGGWYWPLPVRLSAPRAPQGAVLGR